MLTLQLAVAAVFVQRHFEDVTEQMTNNLLLEVELVLSALERHPVVEVSEGIAAELKIELRSWDGVPSGNRMVFYDISGRTIMPLMRSRLVGLREIDLSDLDFVALGLMTAKGPVKLILSRDRVSASNPHQVLVLMVFTGVFMTLIAYVFLRNQLRPIKRLSVASAAFGRGQRVALSPTGAVEVRAAGQAFLDMRDRIERQIEQRTMMLSGISHDLRTPLTRMRLQLALMTDNEDTKAISSDISEMEEMIDGYLAFAAGEGDETPQELAVDDLLKRLVIQAHKSHKFDITLSPVKDEIPAFPMRRNAIQRAFSNIISNAILYSTKTLVAVRMRNDEVIITFDDNGAGIPQERRADAIRPFIRLEKSRNRRTGGAGLGLSITSDVILSHGGELTLGDSPLGGLRVAVKLPV